MRTAKDYRLGDVLKDSITGFQGVAVAITDWINGCRRICLQPKKLDREGKTIPGETFDVEQLEMVKEAKRPAHAPVGGPTPDAVRR